MKRGDIYWANLQPRSGSEQQGKRPVIIVSHDGFNRNSRWRSIIVIPISTSASQAKRGLTAVFLSQGTGGLEQESVALCHQITTLDRMKLTEKIGEISKETLEAIAEGIKAATDLS